MAHSLIIGMTESGKTTLAKALASQLHARGEPVIVLDPMNDPEWKCGYRTASSEEFLKVVWGSRACWCFIDESGKMVGKYDEEMQETATISRHWGHSFFYLSQRGAMLNTTVRGQCRHLFLFCSPLDDCKALAKDFNKPELVQAANFPAGRYFHVSRFQPVQMGELWASQSSPNSTHGQE